MTPPASTKDGIAIAKNFRAWLRKNDYPVRSVVLFGSVARGIAQEWSDIDIAVVCDPFLDSRFDERRIFSRAARKIDPRMEVVCFHPDTLDNKYFTLAQEVKKYGIPVEE